MTTRTITIDLKTILDSGWGYGTVSFEMITDVATSGASIYPQSLQKVKMDVDGVGSVDLAVPDTGAWVYEVRLPSTQESQIVVEAGAAVTLAELLETGLTPVPPSGDAYWVRLDGTNTPMTGELLLSGDPVSDAGAATKQTVDIKQDKDTDATAANVAIFDADGQTVDAGFALGTAAQAAIGDFDAAGSAAEAKESSKPATSTYNEIHLRDFQSELSKIRQGDETAQAVVAIVGDSWIQSYIYRELTDNLQSSYGSAGGGYVGIGNNHGVPQGQGLSYSRSGTWTDLDNNSGGRGVDIADATSSDVGALVTITGKMNTAVIHYLEKSGGGTFRHRIDGGSWLTVDTAQPATEYATVSRTDADDESHTLEIEILTANTSGVTLFGVDVQLVSSGVRLHRLGNGGATSAEYNTNAPDLWAAGMATLAPNLTIFALGTNDQSGSLLPAIFYANMEALHDRVKGISSLYDVAFLGPGDNGLEGRTYPISDYNEQLRLLAAGKSSAFWDIERMVGSYANANARDMYLNSSHINDNAGQMIADIMSQTMNLPEQSQLRRYRGVSAGDNFTLRTLKKSGDYGFQTRDNLLQYNYNGELASSPIIRLYRNRILDLSPIAYWPMDEGSGVTVESAISTAQDGEYTSVTVGTRPGIGDGVGAVLFGGDTSNSRANIYSNSFRDAFDGDTFTIMCWMKVSQSAAWARTNDLTMFRLWGSANDDILARIVKNTSTLLFKRYTSGAITEVSYPMSNWPGLTNQPISWIHFCVTLTGGVLRMYLNGEKVSSSTGGGVWGGTFTSTLTNVGCLGAGLAEFEGYIRDFAVCDYVLTDAQILEIGKPV